MKDKIIPEAMMKDEYCNMQCVDVENDIWDNVNCKLVIDPKTCGREESCDVCKNYTPRTKPVNESKISAEELFKQTYGREVKEANTSYNGHDMVKFANLFASDGKENI